MDKLIFDLFYTFDYKNNIITETEFESKKQECIKANIFKKIDDPIEGCEEYLFEENKKVVVLSKYINDQKSIIFGPRWFNDIFNKDIDDPEYKISVLNVDYEKFYNVYKLLKNIRIEKILFVEKAPFDTHKKTVIFYNNNCYVNFPTFEEFEDAVKKEQLKISTRNE